MCKPLLVKCGLHLSLRDSVLINLWLMVFIIKLLNPYTTSIQVMLCQFLDCPSIWNSVFHSFNCHDDGVVVDDSAGSPKISNLSTAMMVVVDDFCWICKIQKMTLAMLFYLDYLISDDAWSNFLKLVH